MIIDQLGRYIARSGEVAFVNSVRNMGSEIVVEGEICGAPKTWKLSGRIAWGNIEGDIIQKWDNPQE